MNVHRPRRPDAALRLGWVALALLLLAAAVLAWSTHEQLRGMRHESERVRAQLMADSLSQRIGHALEIGIPMERLVGVEALFSQRLGAHPEIRSIALMQGPGKVLWFAEREPAAREAAGTTAEAAVVVHGKARGTVRLTLQENGPGRFVRSAAALLIPSVLLLTALAYLAARFSQAQGVYLRNHAVRLATRAIAGGRYDRSVVLPHRRSFDLRAQQLGHAVRGVHETLTRVRRLMSSLRQTEPQAQRREYLDMLLAEAEGNQRFAEHGLTQVRVVAAEAQAFWISLLVSLSAVALLCMATLTSNVSAETPLSSTVWLPGVSVAATAAAAWITQLRRWPVLTVLFMACAGLGAVAVLTAFGLLPDQAPVWRLSGTAVICGALAGAALSACTAAEQVPRRQDFKHAMPRWHRASFGAWVAVSVWLGPALGSVSFTALGEFYGVLALTLPLVCTGVLLVRWNEPRSPWRHRVRAHIQANPASSTTTTRRSLGAFVGLALAAGLLVAQGWTVTTSMPYHPPHTAIACALGVGVLLGLLGPLRRLRYKGSALAVAAVLSGLALMAPDTAAWRPVALAGAAFFTAYLVGQAMACPWRMLHLAASAILIGAAAGILLAAALLAAGAPPASLGFGAVIALLASWWFQPGVRAWQPAQGGRDAA